VAGAEWIDAGRHGDTTSGIGSRVVAMRRREEVLPPEALRRVRDVGHADIVVGIPSCNNAATIGHVVRAVHAGLTKYFPGLRCTVLNSDGGSRDETREVVRSTRLGDADLLLLSHPLFPIHRLTVPYDGIPGKGSAFRCIFRAAELLGARACAVVDSDLRSITPEWMQLLIAPILEHGLDYVAPYYLRHKYDGTITNAFVYPLTRSLYGVRVRQPIGGDFGISARLASHYLTREVWESDVARYGIDVWMTTTAICERFTVSQAFLGAKIHDAKDPGADLASMLVQVLGTMFTLMETYEDVWVPLEGSSEVPLVGFRFDVGLEPIAVDRERMIRHFRGGMTDLKAIWEMVVNPSDLAELEKLASVEAREFRISPDIWARVVYDLACAFHHRVMDRDHLLRSSLPLYIGWVASFVEETRDSTAADVEARLERLCLAFESQKRYLIRRWFAGTAAA